MPSDTSVWDELRRKMAASGQLGAHVKVGVLQSTNSSHGGITISEVAMIHEYGAPAAGIPERSFIRSTFINRADAITKIIERLAKLFVEGKIDLFRALDMLGQVAAAEIKKTITAGAPIPPPLKPATIARRQKGPDGNPSTRPLVDTGRLVGAISYEVVLGGGGSSGGTGGTLDLDGGKP